MLLGLLSQGGGGGGMSSMMLPAIMGMGGGAGMAGMGMAGMGMAGGMDMNDIMAMQV